MYLARRVTGARIWVYQVIAPERPPTAWEFDPGACTLARIGHSGPGLCALGRTSFEAKETLKSVEEQLA